MKTLYFILLSLVVVSCQNQGKIESEKAKLATIDSMKVEIEKQRVIDSMQVEMVKIEQAKIETQKAVMQKYEDTQDMKIKTKKRNNIEKERNINIK